MLNMYTKAYFSLDFTDNTEPIYIGYHLDTDGEFKQPFFSKEVVAQIVKDKNAEAALNPQSGCDMFEWHSGALTWLQEDIEPIIATPIEVNINGDVLFLYPIGHGSWNWEHRAIDELAKQYSKFIKQWLSTDELQECCEENKKEPDPDCNAEFDYCDANVAMYDAYAEVFSPNPELNNQAVLDIMNAAFTLAKENDFYP